MKKLLHFEGIRGVAAFIVFIAHFRPTFCLDIEIRLLNFLNITGTNTRAVTQNFLSIFYDGDLPVYIFWLMSAVVISIKLFDVKRNENNKYLIEGFSKRYFRLAIPVFASSFICYVLLKSHLLFNSELAIAMGPGASWLNKWYHFDPTFIHFLKTSIVEVFIPGNSNYNMVFRTMNAELLGSFLCFGMFAILGKNNLRFIVYLIGISFLIIAGFREKTYFYYLVFVFGFMWTDLTYSSDEGLPLKAGLLKLFNSNLTPVILLIFAYAIPIYSDTVQKLPENFVKLFNHPVKALGYTLLITNFRMLRNLFSTRLLTFMGRISFSLYLIHIPIMFSIGAYLYLNLEMAQNEKLLLIFSTLTVLNIIISYFFMKLVDNNSIKISNRIGKFFASFQEKNLTVKSELDK